MWIYIWTTEPKSIYVWTTPVKEVYVGTTKVRPSEWKPWANTVAYRPLNSTTTVNDQSWNNYNLTQTGGSFGTYNGVNCFYNGGSTTGYFTLTSGAKIPSGNASRTILLWVKPTSSSSSYERVFLHYWANVAYQMVEMYLDTDKRSKVSLSGVASSCGEMTIWSWSLIAFTSTGSHFTLYLNWVAGTTYLATLATTAISSSYPLRLMKKNTSSSTNYQVRWYISEVIIEDKARTADEISAYYNQTKGNYWL